MAIHGRNVLRWLLVVTAIFCTGTALLFIPWKGLRLKDSPFHSAASTGNLPALKRMIASGTNVDLRNERGDTALAYAVLSSQFEAAQFLIDNGADPNCVDNWGRSILDNLLPYGKPTKEKVTQIEWLKKRGGKLVSKQSKQDSSLPTN